jgi:uncharacterized coiled-coil protein SlyX
MTHFGDINELSSKIDALGAQVAGVMATTSRLTDKLDTTYKRVVAMMRSMRRLANRIAKLEAAAVERDESIAELHRRVAAMTRGGDVHHHYHYSYTPPAWKPGEVVFTPLSQWRPEVTFTHVPGPGATDGNS